MEKPVYVPKSWVEERQAIAGLLKLEKFTIYVGNLNNKWSWEDVYKEFLRHGHITKLCYPCNADGSGLGYAVIAYGNEVNAINAARHCNSKLDGDRYWYAAASIDTTINTLTTETLHVTNFSDFVNETILGDVFGSIGRINHVTIRWNVFGYRYARVTFQSAFCTEAALAACNGMDIGDGYKLQIRLAHDPDPDNDGPISPQQFRNLQIVRQKLGYVRVSGLPITVSEHQLYNLFRVHGNITEIFVLRVFGRSTGCAVIHFEKETAARFAILKRNKVKKDGLTLTLEHMQEVWRPFVCPDKSQNITHFNNPGSVSD